MAKENITSDRNFPLGIDGYSYADLHQPERLRDLHHTFVHWVRQIDSDLLKAFEDYRSCQGEGMAAPEISDLLVRMAPHVGKFISLLFQVEQEHTTQAEMIQEEIDSVFTYRREIINKLKPLFKDEDISSWPIDDIQDNVDLLQSVAFPLAANDGDMEKGFSRMAVKLLRLSEHYRIVDDKTSPIGMLMHDADDQVAAMRDLLSGDARAGNRFKSALAQEQAGEFVNALLDLVKRWSYAAQNTRLSARVTNWLSFKQAQKTNPDYLVHHTIEKKDNFTAWVAPPNTRQQRDGFALTDRRFKIRPVLYEVEHCIYCHKRDTDSCSKGMRNKKHDGFKTSKFGSPITGCPLEEKISEMHWVKRQGDNIGALALIIIDNPMCPGTGHRICNDCMKGCIYQKTEPVNIPQIETNVLNDVLFMPWGFEIYSLLTRWNPLNIKRPYALPYNGKKVLIVGLGPAGYTLSHYLCNEGFGITGIDALKIEPLPTDLTGNYEQLPKAVEDFSTLYEKLDKRILTGFGGVAEYGITVRWDKNFLKVIYLNLARRRCFNHYGGVRFGGTITIKDAWDLGFDHIAIASGAGKPTIIGLKNNLIKGIRKASDFLMALQLTGAAKESSLSNLQIRLPAGVIGGGLTALDTATEVMAYYTVQVEKILYRYEILADEQGEAALRNYYNTEELAIMDEFLQHGRAIRTERQRAKESGETPNIQDLIKKWGGVTMFYRKGIKDSPAYRQNHEEMNMALKEGIQLVEGMNPVEAVADKYDALKAVRFDSMVEKNGSWHSMDNLVTVPLRSLFIAAGTSPNTIYEQEFPYSFRMDGKFFQRYEPDFKDTGSPALVATDDTALPKIGKPAPFTSYNKQGRFISFYGDNHPVYAGNVVKAMASAKDGYPYIVKLFANELQKLDHAKQAERNASLKEFFQYLDRQLLAEIVKVKHLADSIVEVIVRAPMQARKFCPGQFYRVQNLESLAPTVDNTLLAAEGLALTGAWVNKEQGLISLVTLEMGSSSKLCRLWKPQDPLIVMGVTGTPTKITENKTVMLVGGGLGNAVQFSIGKALRAKGNRVIYFAGYKKPGDLFKVEDIEAAADVVVWAVDAGTGVKAVRTNRPQDKTCIGNIIDAIEAYAKGDLGKISIQLKDVDYMIAIGSDKMMEAVKEARKQRIKPYLKASHEAIGSINSPMQCMMKGVCAQCLCKHVDPHTNEEYFVYSCYNQDQDLDLVDFPNLRARLKQNSVQEKLSDLWLNWLLTSKKIEDYI